MNEILLLVGATFVFLMALPGLAFFYAGQTSEKSTTNTLLMSLGGFAVASALWILIGHSLAFDWDTTDWAFVLFQASFASVAVVLIAGSVVQRMKFGAWLAFAAVWVVAVYSTLVGWVWSEEGWLFELGAIDLAGGIVIHVSTGVSGAILALVLGKRIFGKHTASRNDVPSVILGAGILTFGWIWFNSASVLEVNETTAQVATNTILAAALGALAWFGFDAVRSKRVSALGGGFGAIAGLVAITPAAAVVNTLGTAVLAVVASAAVYTALMFKDRYIFDDTLDVAAVHGVAGIVGALGIGFVAQEVGLFYGGGARATGHSVYFCGRRCGFRRHCERRHCIGVEIHYQTACFRGSRD